MYLQKQYKDTKKDGQSPCYWIFTYLNITVSPHPEERVPTFNWVFENQPIPSGKLHNLVATKGAESKLLTDEKVP